MSKFEFGSFFGGNECFAVNAEKYTEQEAVKIFEEECEPCKVGFEKGNYKVSFAYVKWRAGRNEDNEPCVCWWIEYSPRKKGSCKVYTFEELK
ncbi:TPA: hypothetical protein LA827_003228 [Clostridium botulinum]|nr:hypothetical protein [Clostridium botulinum]